GCQSRLVEELHSRCKRCQARVVVGPDLEPFRHPAGMEERERVRPGPAKPDRCNGFRVPQEKSPYPRDAKETLVAGDDEGIDREILEIDRNMAGSLGTVHDKVDAMVMQDFPDCPDILHRSEDVAAMSHDHEAGIGLEGSLNCVGTD